MYIPDGTEKYFLAMAPPITSRKMLNAIISKLNTFMIPPNNAFYIMRDLIRLVHLFMKSVIWSSY